MKDLSINDVFKANQDIKETINKYLQMGIVINVRCNNECTKIETYTEHHKLDDSIDGKSYTIPYKEDPMIELLKAISGGLKKGEEERKNEPSSMNAQVA